MSTRQTNLGFMRVKKAHTEFLKQTVTSLLPGASVFLFGSRVHDDRKGGDIDLLVLGARRLTAQEKRSTKIAFYKKFGEQKLDIISLEWDEPSSFRDLVLQEAMQL